jgi:hypothetical protein
MVVLKSCYQMSIHAARNLIYVLVIVTPRLEKIRPSSLKPTVAYQKAYKFEMCPANNYW